MDADLGPQISAVSSAELNALSQISARATEKQAGVLSSSNEESFSFERDIPTVERVMAVEDILNEDESSHLSLNELGLDDLPSAHGHASEVLAPTLPTEEGSILRQVVLKGIANQLSQACTHNEAGLPTAMAVGKFYAIGTSHGVVLVFDMKEHLRGVLSPYDKSNVDNDVGKYGAVSALDINLDGTRLLCGHAKGLITYWDLSANKCLRFVDDAHPPGFAVLNIKFTDDSTVMLFSNSGGNVFRLKFRRTLGVRGWTSDCVFSGCHGEALTFEPLPLQGGPMDNPFKDLNIVAMATFSQTLILALAPSTKGLISIPHKKRANCLPLLSWRHVSIDHKVSGGKKFTTVDPVLAVVRGNEIAYIQSSAAEREAVPGFRLLRAVTMSYEITAFKWIDDHTTVALDVTERIHLINVNDDTEIEVLDLKQVELVYGSSFFKSIETGGNVSKALVSVSQHACYNSVVSHEDQLLLLGLKAVHKINIKPWKERLGLLVRNGRVVEALQLGLDMYDGKAKAVVGLSGTKKKKKALVAQQVMDILQGFVDFQLMVDKPSSGSNEEQLKQQYQRLAEWAFKCCFKVKKTEILFGSIYDTFRAEDNCSRAVFLELLCSYIKDRKIHLLRTVVFKDFIDYYAQRGDYALLESCLLALSPECMDIHQVVEMCWSHQLYDAMIHVYNQGLCEYATPLLELLLQLRAKMKEMAPTEDQQNIGYRLLVYIRCCLAGMAYPSGNIPKDNIIPAKATVYGALLAPQNDHNLSDKTAFPHVCTLLQFDTREFLNVLAMAFEESDFDLSPPITGIPTRQEVVDILLQVMVYDLKHKFSPSQVASLFTFLARQGSRHRSTIKVDEKVYNQVLKYITRSDVDMVNEERQQALLELWNSGVLQKFDEEKLLAMAERAKFYRLCELIYEKKRQFPKVLMCYLKDPTRVHQAFAYIHALMSEDQYTDTDKEEITTAVLENFLELIAADVKGAARLILVDFPYELAEVTSKLYSKPELQLEFLHGVFNPRFLLKQEISPPSHVVERYIELLCKYQPQQVYNFVRSSENYRLEEVLEVCARAQVDDATAYLHERAGDFMAAFDLILRNFRLKLEVFGKKYCTESYPSGEHPCADVMSNLEEVEGILQALLQCCQRNSEKIEEKAKNTMWFPIFDLVLSIPRTFVSAELKEVYNQVLVSKVLESMLGYISLQDILQKIVQDLADESGQFKDIKPIILHMLETYSYEETLLKTTSHILIHDVKHSLLRLCSLTQRGVSPSSINCCVCSRKADTLSDGVKEGVVVFSCGHLCHMSCLAMGCACPQCNKSFSAPASGHSRRLSQMRQQSSVSRNKKSVDYAYR